MPELATILDKLKEIITGSRYNEIDRKLDNIFANISKFRPATSTNSYLELLKWFMYKAASKLPIDELFGYGSTPASLGQGARLYKYRLYETIIEYIPYCNRALQVITDNIISPDDVTKTSLEVISKDLAKSYKEDSGEAELRELIKATKIEKSLPTIIQNTLLYGDFFVEITTVEKSLIGRTFLSESFKETIRSLSSNVDIIEENLVYTEKYEPTSPSENESSEVRTKPIKILLDTSNFPESEDDFEEGRPIETSKIHLVFHDPKFVVKLQSPLFSICFGYLVFPKVPYAPISGLVTPNNVDAICMSIIRKIQSKFGDFEKLDIESDLKNVLKVILSDFKEQDILRVRLISPERMVHFKKNSTKTYPYGESIFDSVQFPSRLLIAMETATTIQRLSRAVEKRIISIELGQTREVRNMIEKVKESFRKRKISIDSMGNLDTIPSMISTFEDIYVPMKDGKKFIEFDTFNQGNVDIRSRVDEMKMIRDSIVAGLCVPPAFLGLEENIGSWQATLTEQNILFTRSIISYQKFFGEQIQELLYKFSLLVKGDAKTKELFENFEVVLPVPRSLQFEREARHLSEMANCIQSLESLGIPRDYLIEKFLPDINDQEIQRFKARKQIETNANPGESQVGVGGEFGGVPGIEVTPPMAGTIPGPVGGGAEGIGGF